MEQSDGSDTRQQPEPDRGAEGPGGDTPPLPLAEWEGYAPEVLGELLDG